MTKKLISFFRWPMAVLFVHVFLTYVGGYYWWAHVDKIMHLLGGMSIAAAAISGMHYAKQRQWISFINPYLTVLCIVAIVALIAVGWEFFEFILDHTLRTRMQPSVADTMGDLACGLVGGLLIAMKFALSRNK